MVYDQDELGISSDKDMSKRHRQLVNKIQGMGRMKWDIVVIILNTFIILYTPDFIELDDLKEAQKIQVMYACLLHR